MIYNNMKKPKKTCLLMIIELLLVLFIVTSCGKNKSSDIDFRMNGRIQFIVPLNTVETIENITARQELSVRLDEWYEDYRDDYNILVCDKWILKNTSDSEKSFTVAYAIGQQDIQARTIKLNGEEAEYRQRIGYREPRYRDGTEREDTVFEIYNRLINREYLNVALDQNGFIYTKGALIYYYFVDVTIPAGESIELEFDYKLIKTYRLNFIAGKYCDVDCEETVLNLEKTDKIVIMRQTLGLDETADISTVSLDPDKEDYYIDFRKTR